MKATRILTLKQLSHIIDTETEYFSLAPTPVEEKCTQAISYNDEGSAQHYKDSIIECKAFGNDIYVYTKRVSLLIFSIFLFTLIGCNIKVYKHSMPYLKTRERVLVDTTILTIWVDSLGKPIQPDTTHHFEYDPNVGGIRY